MCIFPVEILQMRGEIRLVFMKSSRIFHESACLVKETKILLKNIAVGLRFAVQKAEPNTAQILLS